MRPLDGVTVLEVGQLIAGPFCGQILADFGAEVIKIEPPEGGDALRQWGRRASNGAGIWWSVLGRNKKSVTLNLRKPEGQEILRRLAEQADILVENFRPGTMERWRLSHETLSATNPRLIMVRISGFGQTGPYAHRTGFASVGEAMGGLRYVTGFPDRPPVRTGISLGDSLAGLHGAMGALLALQHRNKTGRGQVVDSAIYESVLAMMEGLVAEYDVGGHVRERSGSILPGIAPSNAYPTKDGKEVVIGANHDAVFGRLCEAMGHPELAGDPRYFNHRSRGDHQDELDRLIADWSSEQEAEAIVDKLTAAAVPAGLIYRAPEMIADPHFQAREAIVPVPDRRFGTVAMQNVFPRLSESPGRIEHGGPELGAQTEEVLRTWIGLDNATLDGLRRNKII